MKKSVIAVAATILSLAAFGAFAGDTPAPAPTTTSHHHHSMRGHSGTVVSVDQNAKSFVFKGKAGKDKTIFWTDQTKVSGGDLAAGEHVHASWTMSGGKDVATAIAIEASKAAPPAPAKS